MKCPNSWTLIATPRTNMTASITNKMSCIITLALEIKSKAYVAGESSRRNAHSKLHYSAVTRPGICFEDAFERISRPAFMLIHYSGVYCRDLVQPQLFIEKCLNGNLIGRVQNCRHRSSSGQ